MADPRIAMAERAKGGSRRLLVAARGEALYKWAPGGLGVGSYLLGPGLTPTIVGPRARIRGEHRLPEFSWVLGVHRRS
jgi:hypothetical protein